MKYEIGYILSGLIYIRYRSDQDYPCSSLPLDGGYFFPVSNVSGWFHHYKKIAQLWRKSFGIVTEKFNLWRKLWGKALRHNFIRHKLICDGKIPSPKNFVTEIVTDFFRHKKNLWRKVHHNFRRRIGPGEVFCDGVGDVHHKIVTKSVTFRHN